MPPPFIRFAATATVSDVSEHSKRVLLAVLTESGCDSCTITSTTRTPAQQALVMWKNCELYGVKAQRELYGPVGDLIIDEYQRKNATGLARPAILAAMEAVIRAVGPAKVSLHCADPAALNVIDIAPSSVAKPIMFLAALASARDKGMVSRFLTPANRDPAIHVEIPQPRVDSG